MIVTVDLHAMDSAVRGLADFAPWRRGGRVPGRSSLVRTVIGGVLSGPRPPVTVTVKATPSPPPFVGKGSHGVGRAQ